VAALAATLCIAATPLAASAQVFLSFNVGTPPPPLPYYSQPALATAGEVWQPGYWAWGPSGYYWVPGTWVMPPSAGLYWTPGYWSYDNGYYGWNNGYWAPQVGFYGGVDYGYGYNGVGYVGGAWNNGVFAYNTAVTNVVPAAVTNVYVNRTVIDRTVVVRRASFNGPGGIIARPDPREIAVMHERHVDPTHAQVQHARVAAQDRDLLASVNHGEPAVVAVERPITSARALRAFHPVTVADRRAAQRDARENHTVRPTHAAHATHKTPPAHAAHATHVARAPVSQHATTHTSPQYSQRTSAKTSAQQRHPSAQKPKPPSR
jgi:hypothetical protein